MAVPENAGVKIESSTENPDASAKPSDSKDFDKPKPRNDVSVRTCDGVHAPKVLTNDRVSARNVSGDGESLVGQMRNGSDAEVKNQQLAIKGGGFAKGTNFGSTDVDSDVQKLVDILSKLNPMAEEFVPPSLVYNHGHIMGDGGFPFAYNLAVPDNMANAKGYSPKRSRNFCSNGRQRMNNRTSMAQREDVIRRTVYVSDIDQQVTEEQLAALFNSCGQVVDCRVCGDPNSCLRFAFIEFTDEEGAMAALSLAGMMLGFYPVRVMPSKTAIAPVNPTFLPRSNDEREMCSRTVYCTNIDKKVSHGEVKLFFELLCGEVRRLRLLGDYHHSTRIAFVEFAMAESAIAALSCSGAVLGSYSIRVSPSKTPVRPRVPPRSPMH
ncbi:polyadenylate-binding protein-interacting protein 12-like [Rhodamnia argentea]|uniref:Polyadenylate-binding protein-interacting protein 12-like n=1 Tax=Rhodamnia argentea TaxID=178133 RepID=A0A8B8QS24_9MYRT|nr:polyadenylate-binding protein-interacting protein 12-like [Rhodamnia argentea]XP_030549092.1 polyadenylate-binding protein-interacting protein 12-like [Rhodamnia argentea]